MRTKSTDECHNQNVEIIAANSITTHVPQDVPALRIVHRKPVGSVVRVCAVGDIGLSGRVSATIRRYGTNVLFQEVKAILQAADITLGNLETPFAGEFEVNKMFAAPPVCAEMLYESGFNLIHLANNHVCDYGQAGLEATLKAVRQAKMTPLGAGEDLNGARRLVCTNVNGVRIGWFGCGRTLVPQNPDGAHYWEFNENELLTAVDQARTSVDVLIISMHIGLMYMDYPRPEHKAMAERLMDKGVDLILMHHAHVLQGFQITPQNHLSCYNLGNFVFDSEEGNVHLSHVIKEQREGAVFLFDLDKEGIVCGVAIPTWIDEHCCVHWAAGDHGRKILRRLHHISRDLLENFRPAFVKQRARRNTGVILKVLIFHAQHGNWRFVLNSLRRARWEHLNMIFHWLMSLGRTHTR
jgi:poly-gamma-glutamate synthesis protein (capsule biosynthesis protein)